MKSKKVLATAVLTTAAMLQVAMPVFAANQSNGSPETDRAAHTLFGVMESEKDVSGQVSFEVPLYVTMAAVSEKTNMAVPSKEAYYIENTSKSIINADGKEEATEPIAVVGMSVEGKSGGWNIVEYSTDPTENTDMTFKLANIEFPAMRGDNENGVTLYSNDKTDDKTYWGLDNTPTLVTKGSQFFEYDQNRRFDTAESVALAKKMEEDKKANEQNPGSVPNPVTQDQVDKAKSKVKFTSIGTQAKRLEINMDSKIKSAKRTDKGTTGVFKVVYTIAALDKYGQPRKAGVYAGDNWKDAGYTKDMNVIK